MEKLTEIQEKLFHFIEGYVRNNGMAPTLKELADHFGHGSTNAVRQSLKLIEKKGYLTVHHGKSRGIQLLHGPEKGVNNNSNNVEIPVIGNIAAGSPVFAYEDGSEFVSLPNGFLGTGEHFALQVLGESMKDAGIDSGDIALIKQQKRVDNGEIAAVIIEEEATLKRFFKYPNRIVLRSENPRFPEMVFSKSDTCQIVVAGKLVGVIKRWS